MTPKLHCSFSHKLSGMYVCTTLAFAIHMCAKHDIQATVFIDLQQQSMWSIHNSNSYHPRCLRPLSTSLHLDSTSTTSSDLKEALSEILERFQTDQRYRNDERYLKLWMRYVS